MTIRADLMQKYLHQFKVRLPVSMVAVVVETIYHLGLPSASASPMVALRTHDEAWFRVCLLLPGHLFSFGGLFAKMKEGRKLVNKD